MNSFTVASDEQGNDQEHLLYLAFGRSSPGPNATHKEQRNFTGHELDSETGYLYAKSRYLDSYIGRFISQDPAFWDFSQLKAQLSDPQLWNSYSYAKNNPLRLVDKDGRTPEDARQYGSGVWSGFKRGIENIRSLFGYIAENPIHNIGEVFSSMVESTIDDFGLLYDYGAAFIDNPQAVGEATKNRIVELSQNPQGAGEMMGGVLFATITRKVGGKVGASVTGANILKPLGKGSTGRTIANNLNEKLAMEEIMSNPGLGAKIMDNLGDSRWKGWSKKQYFKELGDGSRIDIHFNVLYGSDGKSIIAVDDFKFK